MAKEILNTQQWHSLLNKANKGHSKALFDVAFYFENGYIVNNTSIVEKSPKKAFLYLSKANQQGHIEAGVRLADYLSEGIYCKKDTSRAIELYTIGIENGSSIAAHNLATLHRDQGNHTLAFQFYKKAQKLSKTNSIELAYCYYYGIGTDKKPKKAFEIFRKISKDMSEHRNCEAEINEANYYLGKIYLEGNIAKKSLKKARKHLKQADQDNDHSSAKELLFVIGQ